jgi:hypothetical protein
MWAGARVFVPKGLNEVSRAIYCLVPMQKGKPSRRRGEPR